MKVTPLRTQIVIENQEEKLFGGGDLIQSSVGKKQVPLLVLKLLIKLLQLVLKLMFL